jgi:hypothetical protein
MNRAQLLLPMALVSLTASVARAVDPFEIQVYEGDINEAGGVGLEVHENFVPAGAAPDDAPGPSSEGLLRTTLEPSLGLLEWWELGVYLQFALEPGGPQGHFGGFKLRSKWIVPRRLSGDFIVGLNIEIGRGTAVFASDDWGTEFRPILVWGPGPWMFAVNPIFGWSLSGPERSPEPDLEPALKVRYDTSLGFAVGLEYYAGIGQLSKQSGVSQQEHLLFAVADLVDAAVDLNVGLGRGLTPAANDWTLKAIFGVGF